MAFTPLKGIRVLDCTNLLPGPYCTMMLAELGAEVIKVERTGDGDPVRKTMPLAFNYLNRDKKLITLDLKHHKGRALFKEIAKDMDVLVEGFRPGVTKRLGIDFDSIKAVNPSIIYCSISGYGQDGPYVKLPGHDINYQGLSGLFSVSGDPESGPEYPYGFQTADLTGSLFALVSIQAALLGRSRETSAVFLDVSMTESITMLMLPRFLEYIERGRPPKAKFMGRGPYGIFETKDGKYISLGVVEDHFWYNLCGALGFDERPGQCLYA